MWRCLPILLLFSSNIHAQSWEISGYGSLGYSYDDSDNIGNIRSANQYQTDFEGGNWKHSTNAAIQFDYYFSDALSATVQALYEPSNHYHQTTDYLNLGFVNYTPNHQWSFSVGRQAPSIYLASDSRNIDYAHLWAYPIKEVYGYQGFNNIDGVAVTRYWETQDYQYALSMQYGNGKFYYPRDKNSHVDVSAEHAWLASLKVSHGSWNHSLSFAYLHNLDADWDDQTQSEINILRSLAFSEQMPAHIQSDARDYLNTYMLDENPTYYYFVGSQYFDGGWLVQLELNKVDSQSVLSPTGYGGYLMIGRSLGQLTPYGIISTFVPKDEPVKPENSWDTGGSQGAFLELANQMAATNINVNRVEQSTLSVGVRYDVADNFAFKFQFDTVKIEDFGYGLWYALPNTLAQGQTLHVYTASLNYVF